ncbi:methyltransferase family protein [Asanoa ferruginea]|uniref:Methyltransferase family protein n=1 Tax=Asanoa ferruginea TaxID=53367 RepID=A0A3D9ZT57_9ACTN|nr:class I SAM-dependent methyltransferase [Asanoa ferruginea]REG00569.1 methyltransferase family protein [Asanoa ferruginea]GIF47733.1 methyltransferase [Asanoa ferruginea]
MTDYRTVNQANWDERAPAHAASPDYSLAEFGADPAFLSRDVRFDLPRLGDVRGLRGVHLQCHIGTDTISLSRLGARMTGLDFSTASIAEARKLAERLGDPTEFVESDVYAAADVLPNESFDLVFTGIGALCWLPSVQRWAQVVARLLKPGGRLFIREGHPVLWSIDDARADGADLVIRYPYFETADPLVYVEGGTYVETDAVFTENETHSWNHGLGEIVTALFDHGLRLTMLVEHDSAPWEGLPGRMVRGDDLEWRLTEGRARVPLTYTLQAVKMGG